MRWMTMLAIMATCLATAFGARAGESLSPETLLPVQEERDAYEPDAAFGKDVFLVAWQSGRTAPGDIREGLKFASDIVGCRTDKSGKALDAKPFVICAAEDLREKPQVSFGGGVFLVVWQDLRNGKDWDVYAARVSPDGKVLDPGGFAVAAAPANQAIPQVCWDGKDFLVVWQDMRTGPYYQIWGARVSAEGKVLDANGVSLAVRQWKGNSVTPGLASAGEGRSFVLCAERPDGFGLRASIVFLVAEGKVVNSKATWEDISKGGGKHDGPSGARNNPVSAAAGPKSYLAVWRNLATSGRGGGSPLNTAVFGAEGQHKKSLNLGGGIREPEAAWDGTAYVAAWAAQPQKSDKIGSGGSNRIAWQHDAVFCARVSEEGEVLAGSAQGVSGTFESPARAASVASDGAGTTLIAYEKHPEKGDVPIKIGVRMLTAK